MAWDGSVGAAKQAALAWDDQVALIRRGVGLPIRTIHVSYLNTGATRYSPAPSPATPTEAWRP